MFPTPLTNIFLCFYWSTSFAIIKILCHVLFTKKIWKLIFVITSKCIISSISLIYPFNSVVYNFFCVITRWFYRSGVLVFVLKSSKFEKFFKASNTFCMVPKSREYVESELLKSIDNVIFSFNTNFAKNWLMLEVMFICTCKFKENNKELISTWSKQKLLALGTSWL